MEVDTHLEELANAHAQDSRQYLADKEVSWLSEGGFDGVELQDSARALDTWSVHVSFNVIPDLTYETADDHGSSTSFKRRDPLRHDLDNGDGAENTDKGPEYGHDGADITGFLFSVAQEVGDRVWDMLPWRPRDEGVEVSIDVELPCCWFPARHG